MSALPRTSHRMLSSLRSSNGRSRASLTTRGPDSWPRRSIRRLITSAEVCSSTASTGNSVASSKRRCLFLVGVFVADGNLPRPSLPRFLGISDHCECFCGKPGTPQQLLREAAPAEWADTAELLHNADLAAIEEQLPPGQQSFFRAIDVSVKALQPKMQQQYGSLAVLLEDMPAPLPVLETLWNIDEAEARRIGRRLADRSLAQRDVASDGIRLHDLQLDYMRARYAEPEALALIHGAVRLSAHVIEKDPQQFASLVGRLLPHRDAPAIQQFLNEIAAGAPAPWLRPLKPALHPSGTPLLRTLEDHSHFAYGVAVTPDGKRAVSASWDNTLKVWDLDPSPR
jgi:hypothetical protein